jgi:hypothetical protein
MDEGDMKEMIWTVEKDVGGLELDVWVSSSVAAEI